MNVWLDDERPMPPGFDRHVRTAVEAIALLAGGTVARISLDHDLGPPEAGTGYDVAKYVERAAHAGTLPPVEVIIHTANPVGRRNIGMAIASARRAWAHGGNGPPREPRP